jgi:hypothetical protein
MMPPASEFHLSPSCRSLPPSRMRGFLGSENRWRHKLRRVVPGPSRPDRRLSCVGPALPMIVAGSGFRNSARRQCSNDP